MKTERVPFGNLTFLEPFRWRLDFPDAPSEELTGRLTGEFEQLPRGELLIVRIAPPLGLRELIAHYAGVPEDRAFEILLDALNHSIPAGTAEQLVDRDAQPLLPTPPPLSPELEARLWQVTSDGAGSESPFLVHLAE